MKTIQVDINTIKQNPDNPRTITKKQLETLKKSLQDFQEMQNVRPIVVNKDNMILGGNMRYLAYKELGYDQIPVIQVDWSEEKQREFIIKDNVSGGEWEKEMLQDKWSIEQLENWGLSLNWNLEEDETYTDKIELPTYEPTENSQPKIKDLYDTSKKNKLLDVIEKNTNISDELKIFLVESASRHTVFNYKNIAEYYAHSDKDIQKLFEELTLVIVDKDKAIEQGYLLLIEEVIEQLKNEN